MTVSGNGIEHLNKLRYFLLIQTAVLFGNGIAIDGKSFIELRYHSRFIQNIPVFFQRGT